MSDTFRADLLDLSTQMRKSKYVPADFQVVVDRSRFPFVIKCNNRPVAHLFAVALETAFIKMISFIHEYNRLVDEKAQLIRIIKESSANLPASIVDEKPIVLYPFGLDSIVDSTGERLSIEAEQVWKSKKSIDRYRVEAINASTGEVKLIWLGRSYYERTIPFAKLPRFYELEREDDDDDPPADDES